MILQFRAASIPTFDHLTKAMVRLVKGSEQDRSEIPLADRR